MNSVLFTAGQQCEEITVTPVNNSAVVILWPEGTEPSEYQITYNESNHNKEFSYNYTSQRAGVLIGGLDVHYKHCFWVTAIPTHPIEGSGQGEGSPLCHRSAKCTVSQFQLPAGITTVNESGHRQ